MVRTALLASTCTSSRCTPGSSPFDDVRLVGLLDIDRGSRILDKVHLTLTIEILHSAFEHNDTDDLEPLPDRPEPSKTKSLVDYGFLGSTPHPLTGA